MTLWKIDLNGKVYETTEADPDFILLATNISEFPAFVHDTWFTKDFVYESIKTAFVFAKHKEYAEYLAHLVRKDIEKIADTFSDSFSINDITEHTRRFATYNREKFDILKFNFYRIRVAQFLKDDRGMKYSPEELNTILTMNMWNEVIELLLRTLQNDHPEIKTKNGVYWWSE